MGNSFKEEDKEKVIKFLNIIAKKAKFEMNTQEIIEYFSLLNYAQKELLPKINDHIFEIQEVIEPNQENS